MNFAGTASEIPELIPNASISSHPTSQTRRNGLTQIGSISIPANSIESQRQGTIGTRDTARVKTYGDVLLEYEFHPEAKCADSSGNPCSKQSIGLLQRRHVQIGLIKYIGKESNSLEDVEAGAVHSAQSVYTEYSDPKRDEWQAVILPALKKLPLNTLVTMSGMSRRAIIDLRAGRSRSHRKNR